MKRIVVHIDRLVLRNFRVEDRHAIAQGLQAQLAQWLAQPGVAARLGRTGHLSRVPVGPIHIRSEAKPHDIGMAAANSIGTGLSR
ncbi:MAG: hypothetical protein JSR20_13215 [Nitrospira sp.]|nr:hypothetical protein [Nitrospira sp.]